MALAGSVVVSDAEPVASREDLLALIAETREQNVALAQRSADLEEQSGLTARVAELERRLSRDSNDSSKPPSSAVRWTPR